MGGWTRTAAGGGGGGDGGAGGIDAREGELGLARGAQCDAGDGARVEAVEVGLAEGFLGVAELVEEGLGDGDGEDDGLVVALFDLGVELDLGGVGGRGGARGAEEESFAAVVAFEGEAE